MCCGKPTAAGSTSISSVTAPYPTWCLADIEHLPFADGAFQSVLSSHTIEHVDRPEAFFAEMQRVGRAVTLVLPPLWDLSAAFNVLEHRWIFFTLRKEHDRLPRTRPYRWRAPSRTGWGSASTPERVSASASHREEYIPRKFMRSRI